MTTLERVLADMHAGPELQVGIQRGPVRRALRSAALRFMRPFIAYQQRTNVGFSDVLSEHEAALARSTMTQAMLMAETRRLEACIERLEAQLYDTRSDHIGR